MNGIGRTNSSNVRSYTFKNSDGTVAGTISVSNSGKTKKTQNTKKKKAQYNFKELSTMLMRSKTSVSAGKVAILAREKITSLYKKLKSNEYDTEDITRAILHAEQMERVAKKRERHLQEEEAADRQINTNEINLEETQPEDMEEALLEETGMSKEELEELMQEMQELMEEFEDSAEFGGMDELSKELMGTTMEVDIEPQDLEERKKKHRSEELRDIMRADMKYLKSVFEKLAREKQSLANGISLELSGMEIPVEMPADIPVAEGGSVDVSV